MSDGNEKRSQSIVESLGEEAEAALANGGTWEYEPEGVEGDEGWAWSCEGKGACKRLWHKSFYVTGYSIENGVLTHDIFECDEDGNWEWIDGCDVDSPEYDAWWEEYSYENQEQSWLDYARYVLRTGLDPLGNYLIDRTHQEGWVAKLSQVEGGVKFVGAHRRSLAYFDRVAETDPTKLPEGVRSFLCVDDGGMVADFKSLDDLKGENYGLERGDGFAIITFSIEVDDAPELISSRLKEAASRHLGEDE